MYLKHILIFERTKNIKVKWILEKYFTIDNWVENELTLSKNKVGSILEFDKSIGGDGFEDMGIENV